MDTIVGSAGDDTITATAVVAATGAAQTTINSGDSIDGGAGNDTLTLNITGSNNNSLTGLTITNVEKIVYVGSDNLGAGAAALATATATKTTADAALVTAANAAANAAATKAAADAIAAFDNTGTTIEAKILVAKTATPGSTSYTDAQYNAAATAAQTSAAGTTLITTADDSTAMGARATALATAYATVKTAADAALVTAQAAATSAAVNYAAAAASVGGASIAASSTATAITIDGVNTTVTSLKDTQTVTVSGAASAADSLKYASTATVANLALDGSNGTFTLTDSSTTTLTTGLVTASVTGTVAAGTAATSTAGAVPGTVTLVDRVSGTSTGDTIKTLNLGLTSDATVAVAELTKVTKIDGSASTGGLTISGNLSTTLNISTGSGNDTVTFNAATDSTDAKKLTSSLSTGAGNDTITVNVTGDGTSTVNAGAGDDSVTMTSAVGTAIVDGGDGKDTVTLASTSFSTGGYNGLKASLLNFEVLALTGAGATVDASKASQFSEFTYKAASDTNGVITKVADAQTVNASGDVTVSAAGYQAKGSTDDNGDTALVTAYAGTLKVVAKGGGQTSAAGGADGTQVDIVASATALNLTVSTKGTTSNGVTTSTASYAVVTGDVKTASITVNNGVDNSKKVTADVTSTVKLAPSSSVDGGGAFTALGNLTAVTLTGTGVAIVDNSGTASKLASIDASGLAGKVTVAGTTLGAATAGLTWTAGTLAETIKLGSALDTLTIAFNKSTYAKMDSITGFTLAANAAGVLDAAAVLKSDDIAVGATTTFAKAATGYSTTSLDSALATLAARTADNVVFQCNGNTYIFHDDSTSTSSTVEDSDTVIELVGLVDLDNLVLALNS